MYGTELVETAGSKANSISNYLDILNTGPFKENLFVKRNCTFSAPSICAAIASTVSWLFGVKRYDVLYITRIAMSPLLVLALL